MIKAIEAFLLSHVALVLLAAAIVPLAHWVSTRTAYRWHTKSAKANEALDIGTAFALHLLQGRLTEDLAQHVAEMLRAGTSMSSIGSYLLAQLGKPLLTDFISGWGTLAEQELPILFGGDAAVEQAALTRLGIAATHQSSAKTITTLPDGHKLVAPATAAP